MSARNISIAALGLAAMLVGTAALSAQETNVPGAAAEAVPGGNVVAPFARVALVYSDFFGGVQRSTGVREVTHPSAGIYCVRPKKYGGKAVKPAKSIAIVTVEWGASSGSDLLAFWQGHANPFACPSDKYFEVRTYKFPSGVLQLSDDVGWSLTIP